MQANYIGHNGSRKDLFLHSHGIVPIGHGTMYIYDSKSTRKRPSRGYELQTANSPHHQHSRYLSDFDDIRYVEKLISASFECILDPKT